MRKQNGLLTKKGLAAAIFVAAFLPSIVKSETLFTKKTEVNFVKQDEKILQFIPPIVVTILEFMTVKVAADILIDWLKRVYGDAWESTISSMDERDIASNMDKRISIGSRRISIEDFIRERK